MTWLRRHRHLTSESAVQLAFLVIVAVIYMITYSHGYWTGNGDATFHYQRLIDIYRSLGNGDLPAFTMHTTLIRGIAVNTFYPWETIAPFALWLGFLHGSVTFLHTFICICVLGAMESAYLCTRRKLGCWQASAVADLYGASSVMVLYEFAQEDLAMAYVMTFVPIAYFGFRHWLDDGRWRMLACGMILIFFTHLPTFGIATIIFVIWTAVEHRRIDREQMITLTKAVAVTIGATAVQWLPMLVLRSNIVSWPMAWLYYEAKYRSGTNMRRWMPTYLLSLGSVFGLSSAMNWKHIPHSDRVAYGMSVGMMIIMLPIYPMELKRLIADTPVGVFQLAFVNRLAMFSQLIMSVIAVKYLSGHYGKIGIKHPMRAVVAINMIIAPLLFWSFFSHSSDAWMPKPRYYQTTDDLIRSYSRISHKPFRYLSNEKRLDVGMPMFDRHNQRAYRYIVHNVDYTPVKHRLNETLTHTHLIADGHAKLISVGADRLSFSLHHRASDVILPIAVYDHQSYRVRVNGRPARYTCRGHVVRLHNMKPGRYAVTVTAPTMWYRWSALSISVIVIIGSAGKGVVDHEKKQRRKEIINHA